MRNQYLRKILDLKAKRAQCVQNAAAANDSGDLATYESEMAEAQNIRAEIDRLQAIVDQMEPAVDPGSGSGEIAPAAEPAETTDLRASREYARAFAWAVRQGVNPRNAREVGGEQVGLLMNALTETGGTPTGSDGGFLVPVDMETRIHELRRSMSALAPLFRTETVTTRTGWRVMDTAPTEGFAEVAEMGEIQAGQQPKFSQVGFTIRDFAGFIPVSNDLLADNTAGLIEYLSRWFAKKGVLTENALLLPMLRGLTATTAAAGSELTALKTALNVTLDPAIAAGARVVTNQTGLNYIDLLADENQRPLLQPDPTQPTRMLFAGHPVTVVSNAQLPNLDGGAPLYIGDFEQLGTLFRRQGLEVESTRVGGSAWRTNSTEIRGIMRLDAQKFDAAAVAALTLAGA